MHYLLFTKRTLRSNRTKNSQPISVSRGRKEVMHHREHQVMLLFFFNHFINKIFISLCFAQVFDVVLNYQHIVLDQLDIFGKVGRGVAHDEIIPFSVKNGKLNVIGETSRLDGKLTVEFVKVCLHVCINTFFFLYNERKIVACLLFNVKL